MTVDQLQPNQKGIIISLAGLEPGLANKLLDLGFTMGEELTLIQRAPLGDPLWLALRGYQLALSCVIAQGIEIEPAGGSSQ